jgi:hypothetical protein
LFLVIYDRKIGVGLFALPLILLFVSVSYFASDTPASVVRGGRTPEEFALRGWLTLHAALLGLGIAGVVAGVVSSLMYLVQHRRLRHKQARPAGLKLISLERLERWNRISVLIAVPLLSLGFAAGFLLFYLAKKQGGTVSLWDPVVTVRAAGKAVAVRTLLAFGLLLATMLGLQLATGGGGHAVKGWQGDAIESPTDITEAGDR